MTISAVSFWTDQNSRQCVKSMIMGIRGISGWVNILATDAIMDQWMN